MPPCGSRPGARAAAGSCVDCCSSRTSSGSWPRSSSRSESLRRPTPVDTVVPQWELVLFCASLPLWVILARLHGLYDRDEERTDHSSVDDFFGVLQVVTIGTWIFLVGTHIVQLAHPTLERHRGVLGARDRIRLALPRPHPSDRPAPGLLRAERPHRRLGQRRAAARREDGQAPRLRAQHRRLRRPRRRRLSRTAARRSSSSGRRRRSGSSSTSTGSIAWSSPSRTILTSRRST